MYYEVLKRDERGYAHDVRIVNLNHVRNYVYYRQEGYEIKPLVPEVVEILPSTMRKYGRRRHQSFKLDDVNGNIYSFFNCDTFSRLAQIFEHKKILLYHTNRGGEKRNSVVGTVDAAGVEHWF